MSRLVLVVTSPETILPNAESLAEQFGCVTRTINFDEGISHDDEDVLDDGFDAAIVEMVDETTSSDLATILRELRSRETLSRIILMGPQSDSVNFVISFPFLAKHHEIYFVDPTDPRRHPDEMNRILRKVFLKSAAEERLAS